MKKARTSTKAKEDLAAEVARVEDTLEWGMNDLAEDIGAEEVVDEEAIEPDMGGGVELRHPQL